jgi:ABC-type spermidine/putrescine transport system permease subunit II
VLISRVLTAETLRAFDASNLAQAIGNTVLLSAGGALVAVALALPIGVLAARHRGRLVRTIESTGYLALGLPGIVVGLSLVFFSLSVVPALYQTALVLAFGYGILFMPKAIGSIRAATGQVPTSLEDVSRTLGNSRARTWLTVTARLARPGIFAAAMLAAVSAMKELPATLMLRPTGTDTLATELWQRTDHPQNQNQKADDPHGKDQLKQRPGNAEPERPLHLLAVLVVFGQAEEHFVELAGLLPHFDHLHKHRREIAAAGPHGVGHGLAGCHPPANRIEAISLRAIGMPRFHFPDAARIDARAQRGADALRQSNERASGDLGHRINVVGGAGNWD